QEFFHWTAGNSYTVGASFLGATTEFKVSIISSPVKFLKMENTVVFEDYDSHLDYDASYQPYQRYGYTHLIDFSVVLKDNTIIKSDGMAVEIYGVRYQLETHDDQPTNHWTAGGTYTAYGELLGASSSCKIRVIPNPVVSITAPDVNLVEEFDGYWYTGEGQHYFIYTVPNSGVTVRFNDGAVVTSDEKGSIKWKDRDFYLNCYGVEDRKSWTIGNEYHGVAEFFGKKANFTIRVIPNEYKSLTIAGVNTLTLTLTKTSGQTEVLHAVDYFSGPIKKNVYSVLLYTEEGRSVYVDVTYVNSTDSAFKFDDPFCIKSGGLVSNVLTGCRWFLQREGVDTGIAGDANGDGSLDMKDVLLMRKHIAGIDTIPDEFLDRADYNRDGEISMKDVLAMRRHIAGID
ncbi:MAG: dockerin type I repeat-containing protein, partial [Clostridia bacterium]|nr:dockerin type I repeat-containing protein [Clostridia bacterium]